MPAPTDKDSSIFNFTKSLLAGIGVVLRNSRGEFMVGLGANIGYN